MTISVKNLYFSYGRGDVLSGVNFKADEGENIFLIGGNGAGKTTLLRCILGRLSPKAGCVEFYGRSLKDYKLKELAKMISYIPQTNVLTFNYSVLDMVLMGRAAYLPVHVSPSYRDRGIAFEALHRLGIEKLAYACINEISGGERQLALIARALVQETRVIVMDEPTSNLDYGNQLRLLKHVKSLSKDGRLIIVSSHNPQHALMFADRALALDGGLIVSDGKPSDVFTGDLLQKLYGVRADIVETGYGKFIAPEI